jgi:hypothetical protein
MKKSLTILALFTLLVLNCKAQSAFIDSTKNEIGININPLLDVVGISSNTDNLSIQFKHHYSNLSLRLGLTVLSSSSYRGNDPRDYHFKLNDSVTKFDHYYDTKNNVSLNIGLEQRQMLRNKWQFFYGIDLVGGYGNNATRIERTIYKLDADSFFSHYLTTDDSLTSTKDHIDVGVAFVAGFDYFFSKRISAGIQGYFPIIYEFETGNNTNKNSLLSFNQNFSIIMRIHL